MQTNVDKSETNVNECRRIKIFFFDSKKVTHGPILLLLQLCNSRPHRYANFQFCSFMWLLLLTIFLLLTLAKPICLLFHLTYVKSNWIYAQKNSEGKREAPLRGGGSPTPPRKALRFIERNFLLFIEVCVFRMRFSLNKILPVMQLK